MPGNGSSEGTFLVERSGSDEHIDTPTIEVGDESGLPLIRQIVKR
jgi:hypothetical protein